jgi:hypothetical protein
MENTSWEFDQSEDIPVHQMLLEETLKKVNYLVQQDDIRKAKEEQAELEAEPLFGQIETEAKGLMDTVVSQVQGASAGEVVTLIVGIIVLLYWIDKAAKRSFQYAIKRNYNEHDGDNGTATWTQTLWKFIEYGLEKAWPPLWCSGDKIRRDLECQLLEEDLERAGARLDAMRAPNTTRNEPAEVSSNLASTVRGVPRFEVYEDEANRHQRLEKISHNIFGVATLSPKNILDKFSCYQAIQHLIVGQKYLRQVLNTFENLFDICSQRKRMEKKMEREIRKWEQRYFLI